MKVPATPPPAAASAWLLVSLIGLVGPACSPTEVDFSTKGCPCDDGFRCVDAGSGEDRCVPGTGEGMDAGQRQDAGRDAGARDAAMPDASRDAGPMDAGSGDAGPSDAGGDAGWDAGPPPAPCPIAGGGLVAHWPLNEGSGTEIADVAGTAAGEAVGGVTWVSRGASPALELDGVDDHVVMSTWSGWEPGGDNFSVAGWVRTTEGAGDFPAIVHGNDGTSATSDRYYIRVRDGLAVFGMGTGSGPFEAVSTTNVADGEWHHILGVRAGRLDMVIFVDGALEDMTTGSGTFTGVNDLVAPFWLGRDRTATHFPGSLDDFRLYDCVVTDSHLTYLLDGAP